jgi:glycosyltransferase involved in cell wall biosynthesis
MKIVMLVESLGCGGAERQVCTLAGDFKRRGHQVCVATYASGDFYLPSLERDGIEHRFLGGRGKVSWALNVRRFLRTHGQDVVLAFLQGPSAYAELASLPTRTWGLVVSERSAGVTGWSGVKARLHMLADYMVVNSHSARMAIERNAPHLRSKLATIYNAVCVEVPNLGLQAPAESCQISLVVAARLDRNKNAKGLLMALHVLKVSHPSPRLCVDWHGNQKAEPEVLREVQGGITHLGLEGTFRVHPPADNIHDLMSQADAVMLPSFYEGLPNAVCEGMALGKPILMSAVCDAGYLVKEGVNGFLFDPHSPESIADAIGRFAKLSREERTSMGRASRVRAEVLFDVNTVVEHYLRVLEAAAERKAIRIEHWPEEVPDTASRALSESNGGGLSRG